MVNRLEKFLIISNCVIWFGILIKIYVIVYWRYENVFM